MRVRQQLRQPQTRNLPLFLTGYGEFFVPGMAQPVLEDAEHLIARLARGAHDENVAESSLVLAISKCEPLLDIRSSDASPRLLFIGPSFDSRNAWPFDSRDAWPFDSRNTWLAQGRPTRPT